MTVWVGCKVQNNLTHRCKSASNKQSLFNNQQQAVEKDVYSSNKTFEHQNKFGFIKLSRIIQVVRVQIKISFGLSPVLYRICYTVFWHFSNKNLIYNFLHKIRWDSKNFSVKPLIIIITDHSYTNFLSKGWIPGFLGFLDSVNETLIWIAQIEEL